MKKIIVSLGIISLFILNATQAFIDVRPNSKLETVVKYLIQNKVLQDGAKLQPDAPVPQMFFWQTILSFKKQSIASYQETQSFLRSQGIADHEKLESIEKNEALIKLLQTLVSPQIDVSDAATVAQSYKILTKNDLDLFRQTQPLNRRQFLYWVYNAQKNKNTLSNPSLYINSNKTTSPKQENNTTPKQETTSLQKIYEDIISLAQKKGDLTLESQQKIYNAAINAMFKEIGDEYGLYFAPKENKVYEERLSSNFVGIGVYVKTNQQGAVISKFLPTSPAQKAGLKIGDIINKVNKNKYTEKQKKEFLQNIRGKKGSTVNIGFIRNKQQKNISIVRQEITIPSVEIKFQQNHPIITIRTFSKNTVEEFLTLAKQYKNTLKQGFILDIRNNSGGYLNSAARMASAFAKKNERMFSTDYQDKTIQYIAEEDGILSDHQNVIILQNKNTASSAEILASFLQESGRAKIYGTTSRGKGTIQQIKQYANGASVKVTVGSWQTSQGKSINQVGITPNKKFGIRTNAEIKNQIDSVLNSALQDL